MISRRAWRRPPDRRALPRARSVRGCPRRAPSPRRSPPPCAVSLPPASGPPWRGGRGHSLSSIGNRAAMSRAASRGTARGAPRRRRSCGFRPAS
eukprot:4007771-Prymnesium_polylepis.2